MNEERIYRYAPLWGEWDIEKPIGIGSYGKVYKISKQLGNEKVVSAVKHITIPTREQYEDAMLSLGNNQETLNIYFKDIVNKFENEIRLLYKLRGNTNIVNYEDYMIKAREDIGWDVFIKMEYVTPLNKLIEAKDLTRETILNLGIDICSGLKLCHDKGIIHRDIKDSNIFISSDGNFKIGDFGVATNLSSEEAMTRIGTPYYMAPEVILNNNNESYDKTVDIYSLGIVLYRLFNKLKFPFISLDEKQITYNTKEMAQARRINGEALPKPCDADENIWRVIKKACAYNPSDRYDNVDDLKFDLYSLLKEMDKYEKEEVLIKAIGISRNNPYFTYKDNKIQEQKKANFNEDIILDLEDDTVILDNNVELDTVILDKNNETELLNSEDNFNTDDRNSLNKKKYRVYELLLIIICISIIGMIITLQGRSNELPKVSEKLGSLPGNLSFIGPIDEENLPPYIATTDNGIFYKGELDLSGDELLKYDKEGQYISLMIKDNKSRWCFNKYGDFIYYITLDQNEYNYRVEKYNTITNEFSDVYGIETKQIIIFDDYMYYIEGIEGNLFKINLINGKKEKVIDKLITTFSINSTHILYREFENSNLYLMDLETKEINTIDIEYDKDLWIAFYDNCIIYTYKGTLYKIDLEKDNINIDTKEILEENINNFTLDGNYLYYVDGDNLLYVRDLSNDDIYFIDEAIHYISVDNNVMYIKTLEGNDYVQEFSVDYYEKK